MMIVLHSALRWVALLALVGRTGLAAVGLATGREVDAKDKRATMLTTIAVDIQLLLGVGLMFTSSVVKTAMSDMGSAMKDPVLRFFSVEHPTMMILALVIMHIGAALSKRRASHLPALIGFGLATAIVLMAIPWPFRAVARPWLTLGM